MIFRFAILSLLLALDFSMCKRQPRAAPGSQPSSSSPAPSAAGPAASAPSRITKPVADQTAQTLIFRYHRLVNKVRYPDTENTRAAADSQINESKDRCTKVPRRQA